MKKLITLILTLVSINSYAGIDPNGQATATIPKSGTGVAATNNLSGQSSASNQGVQQTINNQGAAAMKYSGGYDLNSAPSIGVPSLTTTLTDTCMGSSSAGFTIINFGLSGGSTWKDEECNRRSYARAVKELLGHWLATKEILCGNQEVNQVFEGIGEPCILSPSTYSQFIPGGALMSFRHRVDGVPIPSSHTVISNKSTPINTQPLPVKDKPAPDDQDQLDDVLSRADIARAKIREEHGY